LACSDGQGHVVESPQGQSSTLDYVPGLVAQLINEYEDYQSMTADDWALLVSQFSISWHFL